MTVEELGEIASVNGLILSDEELKKLGKYAGLLRSTNQGVNLISRKDEENILSKHILHSLTLIFSGVALAGLPKGSHVFDLGTGGGLPGIPVAIARTDISLTLCDSIAKKIAAAGEMIDALDLQNVKAVTGRAEMLALKPAYKKKYDAVITRAVAPLDQLLLWSQGLLKSAGFLLALKGGDLKAEIEGSRKLRFVSSVEESFLSLSGYDEFMKEEKKIVRVQVI